jgi:hypothetical protein
MAELPERTLTGTNPCEAVVLNTPPRTILRILVPTNWAAADIMVEELLGDHWGPLKEQDGTAVVIKATAGDVVRVDECQFQHARSVRFRASAAQGGVVLKIQTARLSELINGTGA